MTDKELENVIFCCGIELDCNDCPFYSPIIGGHCIELKRNAAVEYIKRLKLEKENARKETIKELFAKLSGLFVGYDIDAYYSYFRAIPEEAIEDLAKEYGIEIKDTGNV